MIEVDTVRRNYSIGSYEPGFIAPQHPLGGSIGSQPHPLGVAHYDNHRVLVHWNQPPMMPQVTPTETSAAKSDEDEDGNEDDEDRPFTPPPPRERLSYTRYQLELLNGIYEEVRYPNSTQKQLIAKRVGITREQVKIWFQNRRRKDVIGNSGKSTKSDQPCDTSTSSTGSCKDSDSQQNSPTADENESSSSEENSANGLIKEDADPVVPIVVLKSVIGELIKFKNGPLKGKKNKKKKKKKLKEQATVRKGLAATLLTGSYDMINPPNQVTPTAFFEKLKSGFNHSKSASAFASPRGDSKPAQISRISSSSESPPVSSPSSHGNVFPGSLPQNTNTFSFPGCQGQFIHTGLSSNFQPPLSSSGCDLPVLSELLTQHSGNPSRQKEIISSTHSVPSLTSTVPPSLQRMETDKSFASHPGMTPFTPGRPLNGIYPYPFLAEQPMLLSSLRQPEHIFRPSPHFRMPHLGDDPYQPLFISPLSNPYFSPPSVAWQSPISVSQNSSAAYTQL